jgi:hypothetical protein
MKISSAMRPWEARPGRKKVRGFTLTEVLFTTALLVLVFAAVFLCQLYGMQMHNFIRPKLDNAAFARESLSALIEEVRCAQIIEVGQGTWTTFVAAGATNEQSGNALRVRLAGNTNQLIYYFRDPGTETLRKVALGTSNSVTVAGSVTNPVVFRFEDFRGGLQTNSQNQTVLDVFLQMRQDSVRLHHYSNDTYQIRTKMTRRAIL